MYHTVRVCTPHQLLRYTLRGKGWEQILTEIPGACIVFDEVHSYDPALAGLTLGTARLFHKLGARLMFISATLPRFLERIIQDLVPCNLISPEPSSPRDREVLTKVRHTVNVEDLSLINLLPRIIEDTKAGLSVLIVCNHVRSSQVIAEKLRQEIGRESVSLFHGRFNMKDRARIETKIASEIPPQVLVATQVVEVSLDISYRSGYFEAAPIDALAQRMGRVNRRGEHPPAPITIASKPLNKHPIYDSKRTVETLSLLRSLSGPLTEQDLVEICNRVYERGYEGEDLITFEARRDHKYLTSFEESIVAGDHENWVDRVIELDNRVDVLPKSLRACFAELMEQKRWLEADALTVNIYATRKLIERHVDKSHDPWLIDLPYGANGLELPLK
jgi:CRISPR-associated endonuclease/helicase Cas3